MDSERKTQKGQPNRRDAARARTRKKVLDAARTLFIQRGYEASTIREIAKAAGMSTGAVFANFEDKAELFMAVVKDLYDPSLRHMTMVADEGKGDFDQFLSIFTIEYQFYREHALLMGMLANLECQETGVRNFMRDIRTQATDIVFRMISRGLSDTEGVRERKLLAEMLWNLHVGNRHHAAMVDRSGRAYRARLRKQIHVLLV